MEPVATASKPEVALAASTKVHQSFQDTSSRHSGNLNTPRKSFCKSAHWSADGTTILVSRSVDVIEAYVLPETLLSPREKFLALHPHSSFPLPEPTHALASAPYFSLQESYTQTALVGCRDLPIHLYPALASPLASDPQSSLATSDRPAPLASYPLVNPLTEAHLPVASLLWPAPGTHFLAGTTNLLAHFDATRTGDGPVTRIRTIPSTRHLSKGGGVGMRGTVSALALAPDSGLVAAGTWTRWIGLYDLARSTTAVSNFSVAATEEGSGVMQTAWSPCGRYLLVNERKSTGLLVYDVRGAGKLLCTLNGRPAMTNQRLTCDVYTDSDNVGGFEVWAGTEEGRVSVWEGVGASEGYVAPSWDWKAHESAIGSTAMHLSGSVVATCSGSWILGAGGNDDQGIRTTDDASLSIWSIKTQDEEDEP
jgi:telomerase Cajal body protein 1